MSEEKGYAVSATAHGFGAAWRTEPEDYSLTLAEAVKAAEGWRVFAGTVGGEAVVVRRPAARDATESWIAKLLRAVSTWISGR